ncbi:MAG: M48 family metallopeptidase [Verrucomicrobiae bacterium]|nr:M48 family metallopeptidase [Verrucomicrobiae bacterium]
MWEQIQANRRRSLVLIGGLAAVLFGTGFFTGEAILPGGGGWFGLALAGVIFAIQWGIYWVGAESVVLHGIAAHEVTREEMPRLHNVVEEMRIAAGLEAMPRILLIADPAPNAFAIGRKPEASAVAVTTGLLQRLDRDELQGVIAHEIGHIRNRDVQFLTLAAVMLGAIVILSDLALRTMRLGRAGRTRSASRGGGQAQVVLLILALLFAILGPLVAQMLYFACSRRREYLADASGAQFTRYPEGLASALEKISMASMPATFANRTTAPMLIVNPLRAASGRVSLFSTHPPTDERVRILRRMAGASLADYEAAYAATRGKGVLGARTLAEAPRTERRPASTEGPILDSLTAKNTAAALSGYVPVFCGCGLETRVPASHPQSAIRCIRCGARLPLPAASSAAAPAESREASPTAPQELQFQRQSRGWESFRCACGRVMQISPGFQGTRLRCSRCGSQIEVLPCAA